MHKNELGGIGFEFNPDDKTIITDNTKKLASYIEIVHRKSMVHSERLPEKMTVLIDPNTGQLFGLKREDDNEKLAQGLVYINIPMSMTQENGTFRVNLFMLTSIVLHKAGLNERARDILNSSIARFNP